MASIATTYRETPRKVKVFTVLNAALTMLVRNPLPWLGLFFLVTVAGAIMAMVVTALLIVMLNGLDGVLDFNWAAALKFSAAVLMMVLSALVLPPILAGALKQASGWQIRIGDFSCTDRSYQGGPLKPRTGYGSGVLAVLVAHAVIIPMQLWMLLFLHFEQYPEVVASDQEGVLLGGMVVFQLLALLLAPLLYLAPFVAVDKGVGLGDALSEGLALGLRNYGKLLVLELLLLVLGPIVALIPIIGLPAFLTVSLLCWAYAYRVMQGQPLAGVEFNAPS